MESRTGIGATVGKIGEEALVARLTAHLDSLPGVVVGPGDDCAVVDIGTDAWQLLKTDTLVEGVHFSPGTDPALVGRKAINRALSDIAAMGGAPGHALVSLAVDRDRPVAEVEGWYRGIDDAASAAGVAVVGGETSRLPSTGAVITVAMTGSVSPDRCVRRSGARPGDLVAVTGRLGGSFASGRHLSFVPRLREAAWLAAHARPTAMMDLSDGLGSDLPRLAAASGTGYRVDRDALPCHAGVSPEQALRDGEDYELLLTLDPAAAPDALAEWSRAFPGTPLTLIGEITASTDDPLPRGWEHYREP